MNTILVPTDFSATAEIALDYAITLAKKLNNKLVVVHVYQVPAPIAEVPFEVLNEERRLLNEESEKKLKELSAKIVSEGISVYECISHDGGTLESILNIAKEKKVDLIVMGTNGQTALSGVAFGSVSLKMMEKATCPVMAIPPEFSKTKIIKKITYATDYHLSDLVAIHKAAEIAGATHAQLDILHISDAIIGADEEKTLMRHFMEKVKKSTTYNNLSFQIIHGSNIEDRLEQYIEDGSTDMLLMATHYRNFLDKLVGRSITKNVTRTATIPVVAFHFNAKSAVKLY